MSGGRLQVAQEAVDTVLFEREYRSAWSAATLDAGMWWSLTSITAAEAATLMCSQNPHESDVAPETTSTDETTPEDYKRLLRVFADIDRAEAKSRALCQWRVIAQDKGLKYHSWIDAYAVARPEENFADSISDDVTAVGSHLGMHCDANVPNPAANSIANNRFAVFLEMPKLTAREVTIEFSAGDSGGIIVVVSARGETRRFALAELGLFDHRKSELNFRGGLLLGMAQGRFPKTGAKGREKQVERLRRSLKSSLGIIDNPVTCIDGGRYVPNFTAADNREAADDRATRNAERRSLSLDGLQDRNVQFAEPVKPDYGYESEGDETDKWIEANGG